MSLNNSVMLEPVADIKTFFDIGKLLTSKLLSSQGYRKAKLKLTAKTFYERHHDLVNSYNKTVSNPLVPHVSYMIHGMFLVL